MHPKLIKLLEQGHALQQRGQLREAENYYRKVLQRDRSNEFALNLMGVVCIRTSRFKEAAAFLEKALKVNAGDPETHNNLGLAYKELQRLDESQKAFERSLQLNRQQPATWNNLGNIKAATDRHDEAIPCFESALSIDARYVDCLNNLCVSLKEVGRLEHALQVIDHAIKLEAGRSSSYNNRGEVLMRATRYEQAREALEYAIRLDGNLVAKINLSTTLKNLGDEKSAVSLLEEVLAKEPNNTEALNHLGVLYEQLGDTGKAAEYFRLALEHTPNHASSFYQLSKLKDQRLTDEEYKKIHSLLDDPASLDIFRASLYFALACEHEKRKEYETSFDYLLKGQELKGRRHPYDSKATAAYLEAIEQAFPVKPVVMDTSEDDLPCPIFVVGMPRSGTTLTEQIISSHSMITGAGEVGFISDILKQASTMTGKPFPELINHLDEPKLRKLRSTYLQRMMERFGKNHFLVDKNPLNYNLLGFILTVFSEAKVLYCKRNPLDNCVSIFRLPFDDNQGYSHDLTALGQHYLQHEKLMDFWKTCYPGQILTVHYEETVDDLERQSRTLLDFIGVEFEEQVLNFFDNERIVMTPSAEQVRQPIYRSSVNYWKRYGEAVTPLITALEEEP